MAVQKYTFLFFPAGGPGHINPCISIGQKLMEKGHRVVFVTPRAFAGKLESLGFGEELYEYPERADRLTRLAKASPAFSASPIEILTEFGFPSLDFTLHELMVSAEDRFKEIMSTVSPDLVIVDSLVHLPPFLDQGKRFYDVKWNKINF